MTKQKAQVVGDLIVSFLELELNVSIRQYCRILSIRAACDWTEKHMSPSDTERPRPFPLSAYEPCPKGA